MASKYDFIFDIPFPVMLVGHTGVGKSEFIMENALKRGYKFTNIRLTEYSEGDIIGLPVRKEEGYTVFYPAKWFYDACKEPTVLLFDELNRASLEVRQAVFRIADSGSLGEHVLHPQTKIFAAINPESDEYDVNPLETAEKNRWAIVEFNPPYSEWREWVLKQNDFSPVILGFLDVHQEYLDGVEISIGGIDMRTSRRTWTRLARTMAKLPNTQQVFYIMESFIGSALANQVIEFWNGQYYNPYFCRGQANKELIKKILHWCAQNKEILENYIPNAEEKRTATYYIKNMTNEQAIVVMNYLRHFRME